MKVRELIQQLMSFPPSAEVYMLHQESWPLEFHVASIIRRNTYETADEAGYSRISPPAEPTDIMIVEGPYTRYGSKEAWDHVEG